jgi:hypothetical protein
MYVSQSEDRALQSIECLVCCCDGANCEQNWLHMHCSQLQAHNIPQETSHNSMSCWQLQELLLAFAESCCRNSAPSVRGCVQNYIHHHIN